MPSKRISHRIRPALGALGAIVAALAAVAALAGTAAAAAPAAVHAQEDVGTEEDGLNSPAQDEDAPELPELPAPPVISGLLP